MKKIAVIFADGCEEVEGLSIIDVLRRLDAQADMVGLTSKTITSAHNVQLNCSKVIGDDLLDYDVVAFPGGTTGAENLAANSTLCELMKKRSKAQKWNAAMCASPLALANYGLLENTTYTCHPGFSKKVATLAPNAHFKEDITVVDHENKIITSRGPATSWAFAYRIAEILGISTKDLKHAMLYDYLADNIKCSL